MNKNGKLVAVGLTGILNYFQNVYDINDKITAFIGNNGIGKTTLLMTIGLGYSPTLQYFAIDTPDKTTGKKNSTSVYDRIHKDCDYGWYCNGYKTYEGKDVVSLISVGKISKKIEGMLIVYDYKPLADVIKHTGSFFENRYQQSNNIELAEKSILEEINLSGLNYTKNTVICLKNNTTDKASEYIRKMSDFGVSIIPSIGESNNFTAEVGKFMHACLHNKTEGFGDKYLKSFFAPEKKDKNHIIKLQEAFNDCVKLENEIKKQEELVSIVSPVIDLLIDLMRNTQKITENTYIEYKNKCIEISSNIKNIISFYRKNQNSIKEEQAKKGILLEELKTTKDSIITLNKTMELSLECDSSYRRLTEAIKEKEDLEIILPEYEKSYNQNFEKYIYTHKTFERTSKLLAEIKEEIDHSDREEQNLRNNANRYKRILLAIDELKSIGMPLEQNTTEEDFDSLYRDKIVLLESEITKFKNLIEEYKINIHKKEKAVKICSKHGLELNKTIFSDISGNYKKYISYNVNTKDIILSIKNKLNIIDLYNKTGFTFLEKGFALPKSYKGYYDLAGNIKESIADLQQILFTLSENKNIHIKEISVKNKEKKEKERILLQYIDRLERLPGGVGIADIQNELKMKQIESRGLKQQKESILVTIKDIENKITNIREHSTINEELNRMSHDTLFKTVVSYYENSDIDTLNEIQAKLGIFSNALIVNSIEDTDIIANALNVNNINDSVMAITENGILSLTEKSEIKNGCAISTFNFGDIKAFCVQKIPTKSFMGAKRKEECLKEYKEVLSSLEVNHNTITKKIKEIESYELLLENILKLSNEYGTKRDVENVIEHLTLSIESLDTEINTIDSMIKEKQNILHKLLNNEKELKSLSTLIDRMDFELDIHKAEEELVLLDTEYKNYEKFKTFFTKLGSDIQEINNLSTNTDWFDADIKELDIKQSEYDIIIKTIEKVKKYYYEYKSDVFVKSINIFQTEYYINAKKAFEDYNTFQIILANKETKKQEYNKLYSEYDIQKDECENNKKNYEESKTKLESIKNKIKTCIGSISISKEYISKKISDYYYGYTDKINSEISTLQNKKNITENVSNAIDVIIHNLNASCNELKEDILLKYNKRKNIFSKSILSKNEYNLFKDWVESVVHETGDIDTLSINYVEDSYLRKWEILFYNTIKTKKSDWYEPITSIINNNNSLLVIVKEIYNNINTSIRKVIPNESRNSNIKDIVENISFIQRNSREKAIIFRDTWDKESSNYFGNIRQDIRKIEREINNFNNNINNMSFGSITNIRIKFKKVEDRYRFIEEITAKVDSPLFSSCNKEQCGSLQEYLSKKAIEYNLQPLSDFFDYREYFTLYVEFKRYDSQWMPDTNNQSTGEKIGLNTSVMVGIMNKWHTTQMTNKTFGLSRTIFVDETGVLDPSAMQTLKQYCENNNVQLVIAAPESSSMRGLGQECTIHAIARVEIDKAKELYDVVSGGVIINA